MDTKQLTAAEIDAMEAGPEMDALVGERIFDWQYQNTGNGWWKVPGPKGIESRSTIPKYSRNIAAAWQVVEHLRRQGWEMTLSVNHYVTEPWDCRLFQTEGGKLDAPSKRIIAHGPDAPTAISRCAYKATIQQTD